MRPRQRGVTLVELMVIIAIIAVLSSMLIGVASRPYGANAGVISEQLVSTLSFARMRAVSSRRIHRVMIETDVTTGEQVVIVYQSSTTGMSPPVAPAVYEGLQVTRIPKSTKIWAAEAGALVTTGNAPGEADGLPYAVDFKPDGSGTASTIFLTDSGGTQHFYRVLVYQATGSSYAREHW